MYPSLKVNWTGLSLSLKIIIKYFWLSATTDCNKSVFSLKWFANIKRQDDAYVSHDANVSMNPRVSLPAAPASIKRWAMKRCRFLELTLFPIVLFQEALTVRWDSFPKRTVKLLFAIRCEYLTATTWNTGFKRNDRHFEGFKMSLAQDVV